MHTTLRINEEIYREAKAAAARAGRTLTSYIEDALTERLQAGPKNAPLKRKPGVRLTREMKERNQLMEALLKRTARFRVGRKPTREEMNER
jgi:predicted DNA-binding protein